MALTGWSTSNYLQASTAFVSAAPFTISCWIKLNASTGVIRNIFTFCNSTNTTDRFNFVITAANLPSVIAADTASGAVQTNGTTTLDTTGTVWYHLAFVAVDITTRSIYVNGSSEGTSITARTPSGINQTNIGVRGGSSVANPATSIDIAELTIRNVAVSGSDLSQEAVGASSLFARPSTIGCYYRLINTNLGGRNIFSSYNLTTTGTLTDASHPKITYPSHCII